MKIFPEQTPQPEGNAATQKLRRSYSRLITYGLFAGLVIAGLVLEKGFGEMHVSKILIFSSIGVWSREIPHRAGRLLIALVSLLCLMILVNWYAFRHQHLVPLGKGAYRISNSPDPTK